MIVENNEWKKTPFLSVTWLLIDYIIAETSP